MQYIQRYFFLSLFMVIPFALVMIDVRLLGNDVTKFSVTCIAHTVFLALDIFLLFKLYRKYPEYAGGINLVIGLFFAMIIRENREFTRQVLHEDVKWWIVAIAVSLFFIWRAWSKGNKETLKQLVELHRFKGYEYFICGLLLVLVWSRLIGMRALWGNLPDVTYMQVIKNVAEEPTQSLGYLVMAYGLILMLKLRPSELQ